MVVVLLVSWEIPFLTAGKHFFALKQTHSWPLIVSIIYRPPSQGCFTEIITQHFQKINKNHTEIYILSDFNVNIFSNQKYIFQQTITQSMSHKVNTYFQFCSLYGLEQLIKSLSQVTCIMPSLIDHILATLLGRVSKQGIIDVGLTDDQLIYCTKKFSRNKVGIHKDITLRSLKKYTVEAYREALSSL